MNFGWRWSNHFPVNDLVSELPEAMPLPGCQAIDDFSGMECIDNTF